MFKTNYTVINFMKFQLRQLRLDVPQTMSVLPLKLAEIEAVSILVLMMIHVAQMLNVQLTITMLSANALQA